MGKIRFSSPAFPEKSPCHINPSGDFPLPPTVYYQNVGNKMIGV